MKRAALYVRVSTQEQKKHGMSVDSQITALEQYCRNKGYSIAGLYNDAGFSARKTYKKRPALLKLMQDCEDGKIDIVLFTKLDRWFRSVADYYDVQRVLDKANVPWRAIWEDYDTETSSGVLKVNIMLSVAQAEADRTSERIKAVNSFRREKGEYINGKAPTGYFCQKGHLYIDEDAVDAVKAGFEEYLKSFNITKMHEAIAEKGLLIARETCARMLKNPTYSGDAYGYKCDCYITKEEWALIQRKRGTRTRTPKSQKNVYIFGGLIRCEKCGALYHSGFRSMVSGGKKYYQKHYECGRGKNRLCENRTSISEKKIEKHLVSILDEELKNYTYKAEMEYCDNDAQKVEEKNKQIKAKIKRVGDRYELGEITKEEYVEKINELKKSFVEVVETQKAPEPLPDNWQSIYKELDDTHKKQFWATILTKIVIGPSGISIIF